MRNISDISLQQQIVDYWNKAGIFSFDSSTCAGNPYIAACTNFTESQLLEGLLTRYGYIKDKGVGIDIGAGLGRFTVILTKHLDYVHALEPAENIYKALISNCSRCSNISFHLEAFEQYESQKTFDVGIISGLFYLYTDEIVSANLAKFGKHSKTGSLLIIRDFIVEKGPEKKTSAYIKGGYCYYRKAAYWVEMAKRHGFKITELFQAKPSYLAPKLMKVLHITGLVRIFSLSCVQRAFYKKTEYKRINGLLDFNHSPILTVFIVLKRI